MYNILLSCTYLATTILPPHTPSQPSHSTQMYKDPLVKHNILSVKEAEQLFPSLEELILFHSEERREGGRRGREGGEGGREEREGGREGGREGELKLVVILV